MASNPIVPQPVSADDPTWDLQQRNVEEQIENAIFHPTLGDGATHVESFRDDIDIQAHMLSADHGKYGLDTHTYRFSVTAQRQFWRWHFENEERIRQARLAEHERKTDEFNRKIAERKAGIAEAQPAIRIVSGPKVTDRGLMVRVEALVGRGPGPLEHYAIVHRRPAQASAWDGGWSQWMKDRRPHQMPFQETLVLDVNGEHEISVLGSNAHGRVEAVPIVVSAQQAEVAQPQVHEVQKPQPQVEDTQEATAATEATPSKEHRTRCTWALTWTFPGIAPARNWGSFANTGDLTAVFLTNPTILRVQLKHGTPSEDFPDRVVVERPVPGGRLEFRDPGDMQTFGLGNARDYRLSSGLAADVIAAGVEDSELILIWDKQ